MEGNSEFLVAADTLEDSLSLAVVTLFGSSKPAFWAFLLAPPESVSLVASSSSGLPFGCPGSGFPLSLGLRFSLGLRAVLKKDKPLSSVLLFPRVPLGG